MSARDQVLQIYELLENILLHLALIDLLHVQRVSTSWKHLVDRSDRISKVLFRSPIDDRTVYFTSSPALRTTTDQEIFPLTPTNLPSWRTDSQHAFPIINPFIARFIHRTGQPAALLQNFIERVCTSNVNLTFSAEAPPVSWKSMFLLQPPARALQYQCRQRKNLTHHAAEQLLPDWIDVPDGVTLFDVAQSAREHRKWCPSCPLLSMMPGNSMFCGVGWTSTVYLSVTGWEMLDRLAVGTKKAPDSSAQNR